MEDLGRIEQLTLQLIASEICDREVSDDFKRELDEDTLFKVYTLAHHHDMAHIVGAFLVKNELVKGKLKDAYEKAISLAVFRRARQDAMLNAITESFNENGIDYVLMKGSIIKNFYPESYQRTSSDIDLLVKDTQIKKINAVLTKKVGLKLEGRWFCNEDFMSPDGVVNVEVHHNIMSDIVLLKNPQVFGGVWEFVKDHKLQNEYFYLHFISHALKHFYHGGCGIKPLLDLYLINKKIPFDKEKKDKLLKESKLDLFENNLKDISMHVFENTPINETEREMLYYILGNGTYGTQQSGVANSVASKGGKFKYVLKRIFIPYRELIIYYPTLKKHKILFPFYTVKRWVVKLRAGKVKSITSEMKNTFNVSEKDIDKTNRFLKDCGIEQAIKKQ